MTTIAADPLYNPQFKDFIDAETKLGPYTSMATFLGSRGNRTSIDYILDQASRLQIARNLYVHSEIINAFYHVKEFDSYRLVVAESLYQPGPTEVVTPGGINDLKQQGRAVVYQLIDYKGNIANDKIFDLALFWKDYVLYEKLILDYDNFNPDGSLSGQVIVIVPQMGSSYTSNSFRVKSGNKWPVETRYNGSLYSNDLVELR